MLAVLHDKAVNMFLIHLVLLGINCCFLTVYVYAMSPYCIHCVPKKVTPKLKSL